MKNWICSSSPALPKAVASNKPVTTRHILRLVSFAAVLAGGVAWGTLCAQDPAGPQAPVKAPAVVRIPTAPNPAADAPSIPPEEIIRRFSAQEDEAARAVSGYVYRKSVRVEELGPDGKAAGLAEIVVTPVISADGVRWQRSAGEPESTLRFMTLERDDLDALSKIPLFPFGTAQVQKYQIVYQGKQPVDELTTYIFRVTPRQLDRDHPYFDGLIWVDDHDLAIVRIYGKWVTDEGPMTSGQLPFTMFETFRQPVANKYWMPAYTRSDSSVTSKLGRAAVRLIIRWDQYAAVPAGQGVNASGPPAKDAGAR